MLRAPAAPLAAHFTSVPLHLACTSPLHRLCTASARLCTASARLCTACAQPVHRLCTASASRRRPGRRSARYDTAACVSNADPRPPPRSGDATLRVWDVNTGKCLRVLEGHSDYVRTVAVIADGKVASGGDDCDVRVWRTSDGTSAARAGRCLIYPARPLPAARWPVAPSALRTHAHTHTHTHTHVCRHLAQSDTAIRYVRRCL